MATEICRPPLRPNAIISQPEILNDRTRSQNIASCEARNNSSRMRVQQDNIVMRKRAPAKLPDPWLFDSEKLLRELDRCREMVLLIPAPTHETHFAINNAVDSIWNLREHLRYLLSLHRDGQREFAKHQDDAHRRTTRAAAKTAKSNIVRLKA